MNLTPEQLAKVCSAKPADAARYAGPLSEAMRSYAITTLPRAAMFLATLAYESGRFAFVEENLNYRAARIKEIGGKLKPGTYWRRAADIADQLGGKPEALANVVYGGRMGNTQPGDGWKYRGRGPGQLTGRENYAKATKGLQHVTGEDYVTNPDKAAEPNGGAFIAAWLWDYDGLNAVADRGDFDDVTRAWNGGLNGYEDGNDVGMDDRVEYLVHITKELTALGYV